MIEFLPFILGVLLAQVSPGPNLMAVASNALGSGRRGGMATAMGVASGVFIWAVAFTFGISALFQAFPQSVTFMKLLGGSYLVYLAFNALRSTFLGTVGRINPDGVSSSVTNAYKTGLFVVLTNPKTALMWVAISSFLATANLSHLQFLMIGFGVSISAALIYGVYAMLFSTGVAIRAYKRFFRVVEGAFGAVFGIFGAKLLIDGFRELRT